MSRPADPVAADWRTEVGRFRAGQPRRVFPLGVHVGVPAGDRRTVELPWPVPLQYDAGLRFDLVSQLVDQAAAMLGPRGCAWLTRPGVPQLHDLDLEWHAATARAFGAYGVELRAFRALTRTGWVDVVTGESQLWRRLRL